MTIVSIVKVGAQKPIEINSGVLVGNRFVFKLLQCYSQPEEAI